MDFQKLIPILGFSAFILVIDLYAFQAFKLLFADSYLRKWLSWAYWGFTIFALISFTYLRLAGQANVSRLVLLFVFASFFIIYLSKVIVSIFLLLEDGGRGAVSLFSWLKSKVVDGAVPYSPGRSATLSKIAIGVAAVPFFSLLYGMVKGAYRYQVRRVNLQFSNLPKSFEGLKIVQISDVHSGSFYDKQAVERGIQMILDQKPDMVFFTGDLVNNQAVEFEDYKALFGRIKAPLGVYSVLGNHDYGDYVYWPTPEAKKQNLDQLKTHHADIGWRLLMDENVSIEKGGESIGVIGIQNWGAKGRFPKYGNLAKAYEGSEKQPVKLLLSHDPSHWEAEVIPKFPAIDAMFAGHTHGMQFGIEIPGLKWSPVQYMYKQWAGLYESGSQKLYVNRGFGFIGYPGRVGIWPEISVFTLSGSA